VPESWDAHCTKVSRCRCERTLFVCVYMCMCICVYMRAHKESSCDALQSLPLCILEARGRTLEARRRTLEARGSTLEARGRTGEGRTLVPA